MTRWLNLIFQGAAFAGQVIIPTFVHNPAREATFAGVLAAIQAAVAVIAHGYNPDGTPATQPFQPPTK